MNISIEQLKSLKKFQKEKPFTIVECDKNIGSAIISNELYNELVLKQLNDKTTYIEINSNPLIEIINHINNELNKLVKTKNISKRLYNKLVCNSNNKLGKFRILPKLHKEKFGIRPIINSANHITSKLCKLVELILGPHVKNFPSYIQDSQNLLINCNNLKFPNNVKLLSADIESLYTNINLDHAFNVICEFAKDKLYENDIDLTAFSVILKFIFDFNYFCYNDKFYKQIKGIAMGSICGPTIANIVVFSLEQKFLFIYKPIYYKRFIDDIFMVIYNNFEISNLEACFEYLKLNIVINNTVVFLDLKISFNVFTNMLSFSLYIKPTNTFSYLLTDSNHPNFIFKNIPKSLFIRIRRICTSFNDFLYHSSVLILQLIDRGYSFSKLRKIRHTISIIDRNKLINYKIKSNSFDNNVIFFKLPFEKNFFIPNNCKSLFLEVNNDIKLKLVHSVQPNLKSILVHNFKIPSIKFFKNKKCKKDKCQLCNFINCNSIIFLKNNFIFPILSNENCNSLFSIYIIKCKLCNVFYIGETVDVRRRLNEHLNSIKKFEPYKKYYNFPVAYHFNLKEHNYLYHFEFFIFKSNIQNNKIRFNIEREVIEIFKRFNPPILNLILPNNYENNKECIFN